MGCLSNRHRTCVYLFALGIGVTLLATIIYFVLIEELGAGTASMTIYLIPVARVLLGVLVLKETLTTQMIIALVLIMVGIRIVNRGNTSDTQTLSTA